MNPAVTATRLAALILACASLATFGRESACPVYKPGKDYRPEDTRFACSERRQVLDALRHPSDRETYDAASGRWIVLDAGWCASGDIRLIPYSESDMETDYAVRCGAVRKFNIRHLKVKDGAQPFSLSRYREPACPMRAEQC